jgi:hypothetical protein
MSEIMLSGWFVLVGVGLGVALGASVGVGVGVVVEVGVGVAVGVLVGVRVGVCVGVAVRVGVGSGLGVGLAGNAWHAASTAPKPVNWRNARRVTLRLGGLDMGRATQASARRQ